MNKSGSREQRDFSNRSREDQPYKRSKFNNSASSNSFGHSDQRMPRNVEMGNRSPRPMDYSPRSPRPNDQSPRPNERSPRPNSHSPRPNDFSSRPNERFPKPNDRSPRPYDNSSRPNDRSPQYNNRGPNSYSKFQDRSPNNNYRSQNQPYKRNETSFNSNHNSDKFNRTQTTDTERASTNNKNGHRKVRRELAPQILMEYPFLASPLRGQRSDNGFNLAETKNNAGPIDEVLATIASS